MFPVHGYHGCYLRIDVTSAEAARVGLAPDVLRDFIGGVGLGTQILLSEWAAEMDPCAPDAPLAFVFSPLVGSPLTTSAKFAVVSKSPLTERINDSLASSGFAIAGKACGADAIVLVGRATEPSVLLIDDGTVRLEAAGRQWGQTIPAAEEALRTRYGRDWRFAVIGPAGEQLVRYATISHDGRHAGRGGSGAVLGAKNIKAVAVRGSHRCTWADPEGLSRAAKLLSRKSFGPATAKYRELGTAANLLAFNRLSVLPTRNFQQGSFPGAERIAPETLAATREKVRASCACCTIGCEHIYSGRLAPRDEAPLAEREAHTKQDAYNVRLEYENLFALGPLCGVQNADAVLAASHRCDELGLDTISTGGTIAFAMECVERGLLDAPWLRFGEADALLRAIDLIGCRADLGDRLAEGSRRLAHHIGGHAIDFAPQVKGLEIPGYEPRALQSMALGFAVGTRGADHNRSGAYEADLSDAVDRRNVRPEDVHHAIETEDRAAVMDSAILCKFLRGVFEDFFSEVAAMLHLVTDWDLTATELRQTARRIVEAKKRFNIAAGWTPTEDTLPARLLAEKLPEDSRAQLSGERLQELVTAYNTARGWSAEGYPMAGG